jgi:hypothetical protein
MSGESLTLTVPDSLARELDSVEEGLLLNLLERGLREFKIEQALDRYARGRDLLWYGCPPSQYVAI